ncbi:MAG: helix-turn-helix domain-containing protein [Eubacteriaceae bacterium]
MKIRAFREAVSISQKQLAKMLGINQSAVSQWEIGQSYPSIFKLPALAEIFDCTIEELYEEHEIQVIEELIKY